MEEEKVADGGKRKRAGDVAPMKFSLSKPKFSASRPPLFPRGKSKDRGEDVELVSAFGEEGIVAKDPKARNGTRVIPKLENTWRAEKRMKNIVMGSDGIGNGEERFEKESIYGDPNPTASYGLTVRVKKTDDFQGEKEENGLQDGGARTSVASVKLSFAQMEDERLRQDLISLPDEASLNAYEEMPVEFFGEAILRGMGWEKGRPIGRNSKVAVTPINYIKRLGREGLGADPPTVTFNNNKFDQPSEARATKPGETRAAKPDKIGTSGRLVTSRNAGGVRMSESWLTSQVRAKIINKNLKGGKFYLRKGTIVDVINPKECDILLDSGELLQQVMQDSLETALPKQGGRIMVVNGKHRGLLGKLIQKNSEDEVGLVQLEESFEMLTLSLDLLAEFVGDARDVDH